MLLVMFLFATALVIIPLYALIEGALENHAILRTILAILAFAWFLLMYQLADDMASRMVFENHDFMAALKLSAMEARLAIGFVPIIGRWLAPKSDKRRADPNSPIE